MTAPTVARPAAPSIPSPDESSNPPGRSAGGMPLIAAEVALVLLSLVTALTFARLVDDGGFIGPVLACTFGAHLLGAAGRRLELPAWLIGLLAPFVLIALLGVIHVPSTTTLGLPSFHTVSELLRQLGDASEAFSEVRAPAPLLPGFVVAWCAGVWLVALTSDAAAFRAHTTLEAVIPAASLFVFTSALGTSEHRLGFTVAFLAAVLLVWLTQRALGRASSARWVGTDPAGGARSLLGRGTVLIAGTVVAALAVGPHLPGIGADAVVPFGDDGGSSSRVTLSPLVDIRTRLVKQANSVVFTVESDQRSYWRLTALDDFDGRVWSSNRTYREVSGTLGRSAREALGGIETVASEQQFEIAALSSVWLPAAFQPVDVRGTVASYNDASSTLLADRPTEPGTIYRVESLLPRYDRNDLNRVVGRGPPAIVDRYTALPEDFPERIREEATLAIAGANRPYEMARALQDYFRERGRFTYDLDVEPGHGDDALERFLFETRRGYCEQFAGAYAAMARALGLPARVAVGFTPGTTIAPGRYEVKGIHGHAWPEVYIQGFGWIAFEPTPGRGIPQAESYTGLPDAQAGQGADGETSPDEDLAAPDIGEETPVDEPLPDGGSSFTADRDDRLVDRIGVYLLAAAAVPFIWLGAMGALRALRHRRRVGAARGAADRVLVAWAEATDKLRDAGVPRLASETPQEYALRAARSGLTTADDVRELARLTTAAAYAGRALAPSAADRAVEIGHRIAADADRAIGWRRRLVLLTDPRPLLASRPDRFDVSATPGA